jgi:hypothetical protein
MSTAGTFKLAMPWLSQSLGLWATVLAKHTWVSRMEVIRSVCCLITSLPWDSLWQGPPLSALLQEKCLSNKWVQMWRLASMVVGFKWSLSKNMIILLRTICCLGDILVTDWFDGCSNNGALPLSACNVEWGTKHSLFLVCDFIENETIIFIVWC